MKLRMRITSMSITMGPVRKVPKAGDRRVTKKYGLQIRVQQIHNGMRVVANGRPCYEWVKPADLSYFDRVYLTPEERLQYFPEKP